MEMDGNSIPRRSAKKPSSLSRLNPARVFDWFLIPWSAQRDARSSIEDLMRARLTVGASLVFALLAILLTISTFITNAPVTQGLLIAIGGLVMLANPILIRITAR